MSVSKQLIHLRNVKGISQEELAYSDERYKTGSVEAGNGSDPSRQ